MPFTCELCSENNDDIDEPTVKSELFDDTVQLRAHLVECHAKFVAAALLAPNVQNPSHLWLLANVDYSANVETAGEAENGEEVQSAGGYSNDEQQQVQMESAEHITEAGHEENNGKTDGNGNSIGLFLQEILGNAAMSGVDGTEMEQQQKPGSSYSAGVAQSSVLDEGEDPDPAKLDIFGTALKSLLFPVASNSPHLSEDSNSAPSCRASMVDSKAVRKAHCQVCNLDICSTARQRHVYMIHLKKKDLFKCPHCEYTNSNSVWEVQKHSRVQHGKDARPISQEEKHKLEIQMWSQLCFPEWKQKRKIGEDEGSGGEEPPKRRKKDEEAEDEGMNNLLEGFGEVIEGLLGGLPKAEEDERRRDEEEEAEEGEGDDDKKSSTLQQQQTAGTEENGGTVNDRLCHLCMEESKYPGRHIAQRHLKRPLYECPVCRKFGSYESCTVNKHIHKVHPKEAKHSIPISNLEKYADEIRELQARCFPNRQMKLVRPVNNSGGKVRPRERHQCGICGTDVAQSDRQRHVFHKHLRKGKIFECPLCDFSSNYDIHRVKWHIKWDHKDFADGASLEPISHESLYRDEIDALNEQCFPGWQRKRQFNQEMMASSKSEDSREDEQTNSGEEMMRMIMEGMNNGDDGAGEGEEDEESDEKKSKLDGLVEKAMKTVAMVIKQQNRQQRQQTTMPEKARHWSESDGTSGNNIEEWTCQVCHAALKPGTNLLRHVAKDHLNLPLYQCPICENHGAHSAHEVRSHMLRSHGNTTQEPQSNLDEHLDEIETIYRQCFPCKEFKAGGERGSIETVMSRQQSSLDESRVRCRECGQEMKTEDRQIHVYRHHLREPRLYECPACDFSHYACSSDVRNHILRAHRNQPKLMPRANLLRYSKEISEWNERCFPGWINRRLPASVVEDFNSCRLCGMEVRQTSRHIAEQHLNIPLHQCPLCEYGAAEARLVQRHMKNNHTLGECEGLEPIANVEKHRADFSELHNQCFPGRPKRLSNITIADESRRAKCRGCGQTISKKRRLVHLLEKHLHKPIYKCKYCLFTSTHDKATVETHQQEKHAGKTPHVLSTMARYRTELKRLAGECFNEPELRLEE